MYKHFQRGKFYPQLSYLVKVNTPRAVMVETKKAFRKLPNLEQAITALSNLKGVGTTMASGEDLRLDDKSKCVILCNQVRYKTQCNDQGCHMCCSVEAVTSHRVHW